MSGIANINIALMCRSYELAGEYGKAPPTRCACRHGKRTQDMIADRYERKLQQTERCLKQHNAGANSAHAR
jgi:hypothetical protein